MTAKDAYQIMLKKYPVFKAVKCMNYTSIFVFQVVPKNFDENKMHAANIFMDHLISINKSDGTAKVFNPMSIPRDEYKTGKEVKDFK